jgi:hypothetical protein
MKEKNIDELSIKELHHTSGGRALAGGAGKRNDNKSGLDVQLTLPNGDIVIVIDMNLRIAEYNIGTRRKRRPEGSGRPAYVLLAVSPALKTPLALAAECFEFCNQPHAKGFNGTDYEYLA